MGAWRTAWSAAISARWSPWPGPWRGRRPGSPGIRQEQGETREEARPFQWDQANGGLVKVNPLCGWSLDQVWAYVRRHDVPYNPLHDQGYPSIGCAPCTRAVRPGRMCAPDAGGGNSPSTRNAACTTRPE